MIRGLRGLKGRFLGRILIKGAAGAAGLIIANLLCSYAGYHIAFNIVSIYTAGFLGIPGIVLLIVLEKILEV